MAPDTRRCAGNISNSARVSSVLHQLRKREIFGVSSRSIANRCGSAHQRMFSRIPNRLVFSLKKIVDKYILLEEAHVFLGFNSDGSYVISYTESVEAIDNTGVLSFVYRLHWWLFQQHNKMLKLHTVRLFANEEISNSLQLCYAEWPKVKSKIVVYGHRKRTDNCYITVSAVPSQELCENCVLNQDMHDDASSKCLKHSFVAHMKHTSVSTLSSILNMSGLQIDDLLILNMGHSIGVISLGLLSQYKNSDMLPLGSIKQAAFEEKPCTTENDECSMSLNTDKMVDTFPQPPVSTCAVSSGVPISQDLERSSNFSFIKEPTQYSVKSDTSQELFSSQSESDQDCIESRNFYKVAESSSSSAELTSISFVQSNAENMLHCICNKSSLDNDGYFVRPQYSEQSNETTIDPYFDFDPEPKSIVLLARRDANVYKDVNENSNSILSSKRSLQHTSHTNLQETSENCCCGIASNSICSEHNATIALPIPRYVYKFDKRKDKKDSIVSDIKKPGANYTQSSADGKVTAIASKSFAGKCLDSMQKKPKIFKKLCSYCGLKVCEPSSQLHDFNKGKKKEIQSTFSTFSCRSPRIGSPGRNPSKLLIVSSIRNTKDQQESNLDLNAPTPSPSSASESSGSVYCIGESGSQYSQKSGNCRRSDGIVSFFETLYGPSVGLSEIEDPTPNASNSLFYGPVTFEGVKGTPLIPVKQEYPLGSVAYSQHLVLDVEHVIFDVLRTRCYTTYKFGYLIDYDVQIIDTCPSTRSVIILIVALLNISPRKTKGKFQEHTYKLNSNVETSTNKSQQFQFFLCWQLQTGRYEVIAASPLQVFQEKKSGKWNAAWVAETRNSIRKACEIPVSCHSNVYILNNSSVFQGKSLNYLFDADHMVALRK